MKLTKFAHACFVVEKNGSALVVDPGGWSNDYQPYDNVVGIVITHEHADHLEKEILAAITARNPEAVIFAHVDVTKQLDNFPVQYIEVGKTIHVGDFTLEVFGGEHAVIHTSMPPVANLAIMIDGIVYYPGDSFALPAKPVELLAIPAAAPWMKMSEAMDFMTEIKAKRAFPTHDAILSDAGKGLADMLLNISAQQVGTEYARLASGESIEL